MIKPQISSYRQGALTIIIFLGGIFVDIIVRLEKVAPIHAHLATLCNRRQETVSMPKYGLRSDNKTGPIERGSVTSHYHGSKISGSQQWGA